MSRAGGFSEPGLARRAWPFLALMALGFLVIPLPPEAGPPRPIIAAGVVFAGVLLAGALLPWARIPDSLQVAPLLGCLVVVALLRQAEGGAISGVSPMAMVPVFWCALYGNRTQLAVVLAGVCCLFVVPTALIGPPRYPVTEWERAILWSASGLVFGITVQGLVTRMRAQSQQLGELARTDALTGLANRVVWDETLVHEVARTRRVGETLCVALLGIDDFRRLKEVHGRPTADRFLKKLTSRWTAQLRGTDLLARVGWDELGLLLPGLSRSEADAVVDRLRDLVPNDQAVSVGLVMTDGQERVDDLMIRADQALHEARTGSVAPAPTVR